MSDYSSPGERTTRLVKLYGLREAIDAEINRIESEIGTEAAILREARKHGIRRGRKVAECGTDSGYYRHLRKDKTPACEPCRLAHNLAERLRMTRVRASEAEQREDGAA